LYITIFIITFVNVLKFKIFIDVNTFNFVHIYKNKKIHVYKTTPIILYTKQNCLQNKTIEL